MFKFRFGPGAQPASAQPSSLDAIRRRARHRLIGASVLVLLGVVGLPWLFDTQPRPIPVDIAIDIPAKDALPPLTLPAPVAASPDAAPKAAAPADLPTTLPTPVPSPAPAAPSAAPVPVAPAATAAPTPKPATPVAQPPVVPAAAPTPAPKAPATATDASRAQALLEGRPAEAKTERVIVQVGAFADQARAREVRQRLERAGLKTYTQVAQTADGPRIRVRVGPFDTRAEAQRAADKIKGLGLSAALLTL